MTDNEQALAEARVYVADFNREKETTRLENAATALERVMPQEEAGQAAQRKVHDQTLVAWLDLLAVIDRYLDPTFNPAVAPARNVLPPLTSDGTQFPPGVTPESIPDLEARAEYVKARKENDARLANYELQFRLKATDDRVTPNAEEFINAYLGATRDRDALRRAVDLHITSNGRKARLLELVMATED